MLFTLIWRTTLTVSRSPVTRFVNFVLKSIQLPDSHYLTAYNNTNCGLQIQQYQLLFGIN